MRSKPIQGFSYDFRPLGSYMVESKKTGESFTAGPRYDNIQFNDGLFIIRDGKFVEVGAAPVAAPAAWPSPAQPADKLVGIQMTLIYASGRKEVKETLAV